MQAVSRRPLPGFVLGHRLPALGAPPIVLAPAMLVGLAMVLPLCYLLIRSAGASGEAWDLLFRADTARTLARTALLIVTVTTVSAAIAIPLAWLTVRTDLPMRRTWSVVSVLPLVIPTYVGAFLFISALGPGGLLQQALDPLGIGRLPEVYGLGGATLTLALLSYPYLLLTLRGAWSSLDPAAEDSARSLGHGQWSALLRVTLPQLRPAIAGGSLLVALYTLSDFGAVSLMRYPTFTWVIFQQYESSFDRSIAAVLSLVVVAMAMLILVLGGRTQARLRYYRNGSGAPRSPRVVKLGRWKWPALLLCGVVAALSLGVPAIVLIQWLVRGALSGEPLFLFMEAARNSVLVSLLAGGAAAALSIPLAVLVVRHPGGVSRLLERLTFTGYALPGVVVALSLVFFGANYARPLYQTTWLLVFAYVVLFFPTALGATKAALHHVSPRLEEAARGLGWSSGQVMARVTVPLTRSGVLAGAALVFLVSMKELPATLILSPLGFETLATAVWSASSEAFFARAAVPALMIILMSSVPMAYLATRERPEYFDAKGL